ncbi:MAG: T9SS type A sorting domain-containing protein [Oceanihabitans sp.]
MFPNPTKGDLNIYLDANLNLDDTIEIYDVTGKLVNTISLKANHYNKVKIDVASLQSGMYFLKLVVNDVTINKKFYRE